MAEKKFNSVQSNVTLCQLFEEDAVSVKRDGQFRCGVVIESSEHVSSDEDGDNDDDISTDCKLQRGTVRVAWHPEGTEEVVNENTVSLYMVRYCSSWHLPGRRCTLYHFTGRPKACQPSGK